MWLKGSKSGVGRWYVCWGVKDISYNVELYQTLNGLAKWVSGTSDIAILRIGRWLITEAGLVETEHWSTKKEFLEWAKPLIGFKLPD